MKTAADVKFTFAPTSPDDLAARHARFYDQYVKSREEDLCNKLTKEATAVLTAQELEGEFPSTPEELRDYEEIVQELAAKALRLVAEQIEPVLAKLSNEINDKLQRHLKGGPFFSNNMPDQSLPKYELRSKSASACIPSGGQHICTATLYTVSPFERYIQSISSGGAVYNYELECEIIFTRGN